MGIHTLGSKRKENESIPQPQTSFKLTDSQTDSQTVRQSDSQTDRQTVRTDSQTDSQTVRQAVRQSDSQTVRQSDRQTVRQSDSQSDSQTVRQSDTQASAAAAPRATETHKILLCLWLNQWQQLRRLSSVRETGNLRSAWLSQHRSIAHTPGQSVEGG